jgi:hypothetical protein
MALEISKLVSAALGPNPAAQLALAEQIPSVLSSLSDASVRGQFLAFLHSWLPIGNRHALLAIARSSPALIKTGNIAGVGPIFDTLLAIDDREITDILRRSTHSFDTALLESLISFLHLSQFDCSRAFACELLLQVQSTDSFFDEKVRFFSGDKAFIVRNRLAQNCGKFPPTRIRAIAELLLADPHARIRGRLAHNLVSQPFFFEFIAPRLAADADWTVRATLTRAVARAGPPELTAPIALAFQNDPVFEVQLVGLRALHAILKSHPDFEFPVPLDFGRLLRNSDPRFKSAIVDCFFVQRAFPTAALNHFSNIILKEQASVKLRFLGAAAESRVAGSLAKEFLRIVSDLCADPAWRTRLAAVELFERIDCFTAGTELVGFALRALEDEAFAVRRAAAIYLGRAFASGPDVPAALAALAAGGTFRKRQAAVWILLEMRTRGCSDGLRERAAAELTALAGDPVAIVAAAASEGLASQ